MDQGTLRLLICCPDRRGIIAAVAGFVAEHGGNILEADQHTDPAAGEFFMRVEIELQGFDLTHESFEASWRPVAERFAAVWRVYWGDQRKRVAILVSREGHCLSDLLWRWQTGELEAEVAFVASNHATLRDHADRYGVRFHHLPIDGNDRSTQEEEIRALLTQSDVDLVILARYMQVLPPKLVSDFRGRAINIHHSFLPAFSGPRPYHQAFERGVKLIGATSHYVTDELDHGPIIAQSTLPVGHRDSVDDLVRKGRDLERMVLATAVRLHLEDKILISGNKTVVFD